MIPKSVVDIDTRDALPVALRQLKQFLHASADEIAGGKWLAKDLMQEASMHLWELDPTRFDKRDADYVRSALYRRMQNVARMERRQWGVAYRDEMDE